MVTVSGISKSMVGLGDVDNTSDASKPVSTLTQRALNLKASLASPTFTGTLIAPAITLGGTDLQTSLNNKANAASPTFTGTVTAPTVNVNTINTIPVATQFSTTYPDLAIKRSANIGSAAEQQLGNNYNLTFI